MELTICCIKKDCQTYLKQQGIHELVLNFGTFEKNFEYGPCNWAQAGKGKH